MPLCFLGFTRWYILLLTAEKEKTFFKKIFASPKKYIHGPRRTAENQRSGASRTRENFPGSPGPGRPKAAAFSRSARQNRPMHPRSARGPYTAGPAPAAEENTAEKDARQARSQQEQVQPLCHPAAGGQQAELTQKIIEQAHAHAQQQARRPGTAAGRRGRCSSPEQPPEEALVRLLLFIGEGLDGALDPEGRRRLS